MRKIFSKFRKPSDGGAPPPPTTTGSRPGSSQAQLAIQDVEKGEFQPNQNEIPKTQQETTESRPSSGISKVSKWGAILSGASHQTVQPQSEKTAIEKTTSELDKDKEKYDRDEANRERRTELVCKKSEHIHVVKDIRPTTQGKLWPRISSGGSRPETIEETNESQDTAEARESKEGEKKLTPTSEPRSTEESTIVMKTKSINNSDYQQIIASLIDMRVDLKLEIQKLNNKVSKIDDHISEVVKKLSIISTTTTQTGEDVNLNESVIDSSLDTKSPPDSGNKLMKSEQTKKDAISKSAEQKSGSKTQTTCSVPIKTTVDSNSKSSSTTKHLTKIQKQMSDTSFNESDEVRAMLESEIAEQEVEMTDDDQDQTSKL